MTGVSPAFVTDGGLGSMYPILSSIRSCPGVGGLRRHSAQRKSLYSLSLSGRDAVRKTHLGNIALWTIFSTSASAARKACSSVSVRPYTVHLP